MIVFVRTADPTVRVQSFDSICLCVSGFHSLEFLSTGRVQPGSGPHFEQVTVFDGVVISHCDSGTQQEHFKPILESHDLTGTCRAACYDVFDALGAISKFINHTGSKFVAHLFCHVFILMKMN